MKKKILLRDRLNSGNTQFCSKKLSESTMSSVITHLTNIEECLMNMHFINVITLEDDDKVEIRSNLRTMKDIGHWVEEFSLQSDTKWNVRTTKPVGERMVCRKMYECHHSSFNKTDKIIKKRMESKNAYCTASIKVKIKKKTYQTCRRDSYMKRDLWAVIVMTKEHTHSLGTPESLRFLPSNQEATFFKYFVKGMTATQARKFHHGLLLAQQCSSEELANPRINPSKRAVYAWYHNWRSSRLKGTSLNFEKIDDVEVDPDCNPAARRNGKRKRKRNVDVVVVEVKSADVDGEDSLLQEEIEILKMEEAAWLTDVDTKPQTDDENVEVLEFIVSEDDDPTIWTAMNDEYIEKIENEDDLIIQPSETSNSEDEQLVTRKDAVLNPMFRHMTSLEHFTANCEEALTETKMS